MRKFIDVSQSDGIYDIQQKKRYHFTVSDIHDIKAWRKEQQEQLTAWEAEKAKRLDAKKAFITRRWDPKKNFHEVEVTNTPPIDGFPREGHPEEWKRAQVKAFQSNWGTHLNFSAKSFKERMVNWFIKLITNAFPD